MYIWGNPHRAEIFLQLPFFFVATYGFYARKYKYFTLWPCRWWHRKSRAVINPPYTNITGRNWLRLPCLVYGAHTATTLIPILGAFGKCVYVVGCGWGLNDIHDNNVCAPSTPQLHHPSFHTIKRWHWLRCKCYCLRNGWRGERPDSFLLLITQIFPLFDGSSTADCYYDDVRGAFGWIRYIPGKLVNK